MAYLGSPPASQAASFAGVYSQAFSGNGSTTSFTLGRYVAQPANIEVIVNNVQQSPFDGSYSLSGGTSLVFSEAPSSGSNNIYVIYRDYPVQTLTDTGAVRKTGDTMSGTLNSIVSPQTAVETTVLQMADSTTFNNYLGSIRTYNNGGYNQSTRFYVTNAGGAKSNEIKAMEFNGNGYVTMPFQPFVSCGAPNGVRSAAAYNHWGGVGYVFTNDGNCWNSSTGRFTAPVAGRYFVHAQIRMSSETSVSYNYIQFINSNTSANGTPLTLWSPANDPGTYKPHSLTYIFKLNANDWVEPKLYLNASATLDGGYTGQTDDALVIMFLG